jgi:hypothetical protein
MMTMMMKDSFVASNMYMLVYRRRSDPIPAPALSPALQQMVMADNECLQAEISSSQESLVIRRSQIEQLVLEVEDLCRYLRQPVPDDQSEWIETSWLQAWLKHVAIPGEPAKPEPAEGASHQAAEHQPPAEDDVVEVPSAAAAAEQQKPETLPDSDVMLVEPGPSKDKDAPAIKPISLCGVLCEHGKLSPHKLALVKRIPTVCMEMLIARCGMDPQSPRLRGTDASCMACVQTVVRGVNTNDQIKERRGRK